MKNENQRLYELIDTAISQLYKYMKKAVEYKYQEYIYINFGKSSEITVSNLKSKLDKFIYNLEKTNKRIEENYNNLSDNNLMKKYYELFKSWIKTEKSCLKLIEELQENRAIRKYDIKCNKEEISQKINSLNEQCMNLYKQSNKIFDDMTEIRYPQA